MLADDHRLVAHVEIASDHSMRLTGIAALDRFPLLMRRELRRSAELHVVCHRSLSAFACTGHSIINSRSNSARLPTMFIIRRP
jgi:hypothetical protein